MLGNLARGWSMGETQERSPMYISRFSFASILLATTLLSAACSPSDEAHLTPEEAAAAQAAAGNGSNSQGGQALPPNTVKVDPTLKPLRTGKKPLGSVRDAHGTQADFVENELLVFAPSRSVIDSFATRIGAVKVTRIDTRGSDAEQGAYAVEVESKRNSSELPGLMRAAAPNMRNDLTLSSDRAARLMALAFAETAKAGMTIGLNWIMQPQEEGKTNESAWGVPYDSSARTWPYMVKGGPLDIGIVGAWNRLAGSSQRNQRTNVTIFDGGFRRTSDLPSDTFIDPPDAYGRPNPDDCGGNGCPWHGYQTSTVLAGVEDNRQGVAGAAGPHAKLHLVSSPSADLKQYIEFVGGILNSLDSKVVNVSAAADVPAVPSILVEGAWWAVRTMMGDRMPLVVASAGNNGLDVDREDSFGPFTWEAVVVAPCELEGVLCVGGTGGWQDRGERAGKSAWGSKNEATSVSLFAPYNVWAMKDDPAAPDSGQITMVSGTSFSAPLVSGVAAMVYAANPNLKASQVRDILLQSAHVEPEPVRRFLNADAAVKMALGAQAPLVSMTQSGQGTTNKAYTIELVSQGSSTFRFVNESAIFAADPNSSNSSVGSLSLSIAAPSGWPVERVNAQKYRITPTSNGDFEVGFVVSNPLKTNGKLRIHVQDPEAELLMHGGSGQAWVGAEYYAALRAYELETHGLGAERSLIPCRQVRWIVTGEDGTVAATQAGPDSFGSCTLAFKPTRAQAYAVEAKVMDAAGLTLKRSHQVWVTAAAGTDQNAVDRTSIKALAISQKGGRFEGLQATNTNLGCSFTDAEVRAPITLAQLGTLERFDIALVTPLLDGAVIAANQANAGDYSSAADGRVAGITKRLFSGGELDRTLVPNATHISGPASTWFGDHAIGMVNIQSYGMKFMRPTIIPIGGTCMAN
jgi:subtilisin family serine protease